MLHLECHWFRERWPQKSLSIISYYTQGTAQINGLANQPFCRLDIWRAQLKLNWTVNERLLLSDQLAVGEWRLILYKEQWTVLQSLIFIFIHFDKIVCERVFSCSTWHSGNFLDYHLALGTDCLVDRTFLKDLNEVQLKSWWKFGSVWSTSSLKKQANLI